MWDITTNRGFARVTFSYRTDEDGRGLYTLKDEQWISVLGPEEFTLLGCRDVYAKIHREMKKIKVQV